MSYKKIKNAAVLLTALPLAAIVGCDQISFFTEYFSSGNNKEQAAEAAPAQPPKTANPKPAAQWAPNTLAQVGSWTITLEEFNQKLSNLKEAVPEFDVTSPESKRQILEELIRQQLLLIDADKSGLTKRKDIVEAVEEFKKTIIIREMATKIAEGAGEATTLEAQDYYNENKNFIVDPPQWKVREIVSATEEDAKGILIELLKGVDFAETAAGRSTSASASKGGELEAFLQPPFAAMGDQLITMEVGDISRVFKGPEGFYIIKLEEKVGGEPKNFSDIKDEIITGLTIIKQQQALVDYIDKLKQNIKIKTNERLISSKQ